MSPSLLLGGLRAAVGGCIRLSESVDRFRSIRRSSSSGRVHARTDGKLERHQMCATPALYLLRSCQGRSFCYRLPAGVLSLPRYGTDRARLPQRDFEHNQLYLQELVVDGRQPGKRGPLGIATPFPAGSFSTRFARDIQFRSAFPALCP